MIWLVLLIPVIWFYCVCLMRAAKEREDAELVALAEYQAAGAEAAAADSPRAETHRPARGVAAALRQVK